MNTPKDILISGASVAGPALAYWLRKYGYNPTIVERAPELREGGYAVDFRGTAHLFVLERMGILGEIEQAATHMGATAYVNAEGKPLATMPEDLFSGDIEILRGDLARILYDLTKDSVEYIFDDSITSLEEDADGVWVEFERSERRRFSLVIGADGLHSNVRRLAFGSESAFVRNLGLYCAIYTTPNLLELDHSGLAYSTPGKLVATYSARANTEAKAVFYFGAPELSYDRRDIEQQKQILAAEFADSGWETARFLDELDAAQDFYFDSISQVKMDTWSRGRVSLLGDAASCPSPLSGMGTGLAVVGAYVLAGELAAADGDHEAGFAAYEALMRPYALGCQKIGEGVGKWMVPESRFMAWFLKQNYKVLPYLPWKGMMAKGIRKTASAIQLGTYS